MNYNDFFFFSAEEVFLFGRVFFLAGWGGLLVGVFFFRIILTIFFVFLPFKCHHKERNQIFIKAKKGKLFIFYQMHLV